MNKTDKEHIKAYSIVETLENNNFEAYYIGGYVRDMLLYINSFDIDIATNATPDEIIEIFGDDNVDAVGKSFLVSIVNGIDVATYRTDVYSASGHCEPEQAYRLYDDVKRRDLTINSMAYSPIRGKIIDLFKGQDDLKNGIVRFVGDPVERILEDPVRMIRACRFVALLSNNGEIARFAPSTFKAIKDNKEMIREVAPERIHKEIMKVMSACDEPSVFFNKLYMTGLLEIIMPELHNCYWFSGGNHHTEYIHEHLLTCCDELPKEDPVLRIAGLFHDIGKPVVYDEDKFTFILHEQSSADLVVDIMQRLKFSTKDIKRVHGLVLLHMSDMERTSVRTIRRVLSKCSKYGVDWRNLLKLKIADGIANLRKDSLKPKKIEKIISNYERQLANPNLVVCLKDLKINGNDIKSLGFEGVEIKTVLERLLKGCISSPSMNDYRNLMLHAFGFHKQFRKDALSKDRNASRTGFFSWSTNIKETEGESFGTKYERLKEELKERLDNESNM